MITLCEEISSQKYEKLKYDPLSWFCPACIKEIPFSFLLPLILILVCLASNQQKSARKSIRYRNINFGHCSI